MRDTKLPRKSENVVLVQVQNGFVVRSEYSPDGRCQPEQFQHAFESFDGMCEYLREYFDD